MFGCPLLFRLETVEPFMRYQGHFRFLAVNRGPVRWAFSRFDHDVRVAVMNIEYGLRSTGKIAWKNKNEICKVRLGQSKVRSGQGKVGKTRTRFENGYRNRIRNVYRRTTSSTEYSRNARDILLIIKPLRIGPARNQWLLSEGREQLSFSKL